MNTDRFQPPDARDDDGLAARREQVALHRADRAHDRRHDAERIVARCVRCSAELPQPVTTTVCDKCHAAGVRHI